MMDEIMFSSKPENLFECTEPLDAATMPMYVLTNASKVNGSGILARDGVLDKIGELLGKNFYVLPSSIHEVLIVPDNGDMQAKELESMVKEVNATQVAPADLLSDKVQYYDRAAKTLGRKQEKGLLERLAENKAQVKEQAEKAPKEKQRQTGTEFIRAAMRLPFLYSKKWRMTSEISDCRKALCRYGFGGGIGRR